MVYEVECINKDKIMKIKQNEKRKRRPGK